MGSSIVVLRITFAKSEDDPCAGIAKQGCPPTPSQERPLNSAICRLPRFPDKSPQGAIEHPLHAESVRELSVIVAPGLDAERVRHRPSQRHSLE